MNERSLPSGPDLRLAAPLHKRKQAALEAQLDQLLSGDSEQQTS